VDLKTRTRIIAFGGSVIGLVCLEIGRRTHYGDVIVSLIFLAFFAWIGIAVWLREGRSTGQSPNNDRDG
jgi:hypothetical protein